MSPRCACNDRAASPQLRGPPPAVGEPRSRDSAGILLAHAGMTRTARWIEVAVAALAASAGCVGHVGDDGPVGPGAADASAAGDGGRASDADGGRAGDADAGGAADAAGGGGPRPGDGVELRTYDPLNDESDPSWGAVLTDIVQHCPPEWVSTYYDADKVTHGHETSHGIHAYLRNERNDTGRRANALYLLDGRYALVVEPGIRKSEVAPYVPSALRGSRYATYVTGQTAWDDTPLYLFDEWNAYVNGTAVAVDLERAGKWTYGWRDACAGTIEFVAYALAVGRAVEERDPDYFADYAQFRELLAWNLRRSMALYRECAALEPFAWDQQDAYFEALRSGPDGAELRAFVDRTYGAAFTAELFGD
ncbi:MAG: hypothetical protein D6689_06595 [Deltaproteobacteria bacterium]|nr:MAG: hypothetical protein D6689_06595 [Deltaproteobacteria bacterium]